MLVTTAVAFAAVVFLSWVKTGLSLVVGLIAIMDALAATILYVKDTDADKRTTVAIILVESGAIVALVLPWVG